MKSAAPYLADQISPWLCFINHCYAKSWFKCAKCIRLAKKAILPSKFDCSPNSPECLIGFQCCFNCLQLVKLAKNLKIECFDDLTGSFPPKLVDLRIEQISTSESRRRRRIRHHASRFVSNSSQAN